MPGLVSPTGPEECKERWDALEEIYRSLTDQTLPEVMSPKERRRIDVIIKFPDGTQQFVEVDERQHFNPWRAITLDHYPTNAKLGFPKDLWQPRALTTPAIFGGKWARPRPPLFPKHGGRHQQRAFRDSIADLLSPLYGLRPTIRISDLEVATWQSSSNPIKSFSVELITRGVPRDYVRLGG